MKLSFLSNFAFSLLPFSSSSALRKIDPETPLQDIIINDSNTLNKLEKRGRGFPESIAHIDTIMSLQPNASRLFDTVAYLSSTFPNRYYNSNHGKTASLWLLRQIEAIIASHNNGNEGQSRDGNSGSHVSASVELIEHSWKQPSLIARITPVRSSASAGNTKTQQKTNIKKNRKKKKSSIIVVSSHLDTKNFFFSGITLSPGADDNASGCATILEGFRLLLAYFTIHPEQLANEIQFHWYAGEEAGLKGSRAVLSNSTLIPTGRVRAQLHQDMTGFMPRSSSSSARYFSLIRDNTDSALNKFVSLIVRTLFNDSGKEEEISMLEIEMNDRCGYGCSDHFAAHEAGIPVSYLFEAPLRLANPFVHTPLDTVDRLDAGKMADHAHVVVGFAIELGQHQF
jgi:leucyl aminopeptidase